MAVKDAIEKIVGPLWEMHETLTKERDDLRERLAEKNEEVNQLEKVLRQADPDKFVKEASQNGSRASTRTVSEKVIDQVKLAMWQESHATHSITGLARKLGLSDATVDNAMAELRARGDVRSLGRVPNPAGRGAVLGFKIGEHVTPPTEIPPSNVPRHKPGAGAKRPGVSAAKVDEAWGLIQAFSEPTFARRDLRKLVPWHRSQVDAAFIVLEEQGKIAQAGHEEGHGGSTLYKLAGE